MLKEYPKFKDGEVKLIFEKLSSQDKKDLENYFKYRTARGITSKDKLDDVKRIIMQLRFIAEKNLEKMNYTDVLNISSLIKESSFSDYRKNEILVALKNYLKWKILDWSKLRLDDIRLIKNPENNRKIKNTDLLDKKDIEKLMKHETKMFWKAFLITQYEAGLRTKETRYLTWKDINFNADEDLSEINIYSTKTKKARVVYVKEATFYLQKLKEEQDNLEQKGVYIFHSKRNLNNPIDKATISIWMRRLSKRALGRECWNYLLRHSRGNELYKLSKQGKVSKDIAVEFMGHSEKMSKVYTHLNSNEVKLMMKEQVYHLEDLPPEKRIELEKEIKDMNDKFENKEKIYIEMFEKLNKKIESLERKN